MARNNIFHYDREFYEMGAKDVSLTGYKRTVIGEKKLKRSSEESLYKRQAEGGKTKGNKKLKRRVVETGEAWKRTIVQSEEDKQMEKQQREEYVRLRKVAQKRIKRLEKAGYEWTDVYRYNAAHYPKARDIKDPGEISLRLQDIYKFLSSEKSTVTGWKQVEEARLAALEKRGLEVPAGKRERQRYVRDFGEYMRFWRLTHEEWGSERAVEVYDAMKRYDVSLEEIKKNFDWWAQNAAALEMYEYSPGETTVTAEEARKWLKTHA